MILNVDPRYYGCAEVKRFLYEYVERELDEKLLIALDNHLLMCSSCAALKETYEKSTETVRSYIIDDVEIPADFKSDLVKTLEQADATD